jgi:hypothetical protein
MRYEIGDGVRLSVTFTNTTSGDFVDPTTVTLTIQQPDGTAAAGVVVTRSATGKYHADFQPGDPGVYRYRWAGTGAYPAAAEGAFTVSRSLLSV